ncbi:MAG: glycosyltransferase family 2 protein [Phycisphaeraceae bacterium]
MEDSGPAWWAKATPQGVSAADAVNFCFMPATPADHAPELSIVVPALNEEDNVAPLIDEIRRVIREQAGIDAELIVVDDGSTDSTLAKLRAAAAENHWIRVLHRDIARGQSAAMFAGIAAARGRYVATLDADLQNDPADLPAMLDKLRRNEADMVQGDRSANRNDTMVRRFSSWIGRTTRRLLLGDSIRDTGCTARVLRTDIARRFPLQYKGAHRFLPFYARLLGGRVIEMSVHHRPRVAGVAKYGVLNRGWAGLIDCLALRWMANRYRDAAAEEIEP